MPSSFALMSNVCLGHAQEYIKLTQMLCVALQCSTSALNETKLADADSIHLHTQAVSISLV